MIEQCGAQETFLDFLGLSLGFTNHHAYPASMPAHLGTKFVFIFQDTRPTYIAHIRSGFNVYEIEIEYHVY